MRQASQNEARKKDTREKIALGGLIAKAGLRYEKRALIGPASAGDRIYTSAGREHINTLLRRSSSVYQAAAE